MRLNYRLTKILAKTLTNICFLSIIFSIIVVEAHGYGGSSSSGSGGTRGMAPANIDPFGNIIKYEVRDGDLTHNETEEYSFSAPELSIYKVLINGKENEFGVSVRIESLRNTSKYAKKSAPGIVYRNENIWIGSKRINYIAVKFKVKNSWIDSNGFNETIHPYLLKWNGTTWLALKTNVTGKDGLYTYFEAPKAGNSYIGIFAISGPPKKTFSLKNNGNNGSWPTNVTNVDAEKYDIIIPEIQEQETENNNPNKELPGFDVIITMTAIIGIIIAFSNLKKREKR